MTTDAILTRLLGVVDEKPRLKFFGGDVWTCVSRDFMARGHSQAAAYKNWHEYMERVWTTTANKSAPGN